MDRLAAGVALSRCHRRVALVPGLFGHLVCVCMCVYVPVLSVTSEVRPVFFFLLPVGTQCALLDTEAAVFNEFGIHLKSNLLREKLVSEFIM